MRTATPAAPAGTDAGPASPDPPRSRFERLSRHARSAGLLAFVALSFLWFARTWVDPVHRHAGIAGDPEAYISTLAWPPFAVLHHLNPLHTDYLLHPAGANLMWTIPPGFGLVLWPLTATIGVVPTYNLLATLSVAASAWCAQLALRRFAPGELGPFVGALFYGFSPYMAAHSTGHAMLTVAVLPPLLLLLLHEAFVRQRWPVWATGVALGALVAFQLSTFLELVAAGAVAAVLLLVAFAVAYRRVLRARLRFLFATLAVAVLTFVVLGGFQLWNVLFGAQNLTTADGNVHPPNVVVADLLEFVVPSRYNAGGLPFRSITRNFTATGAEMNAYVGLPLLIVLGVIVVRHRRSRTVQIAAVLTGVMALLSMGPRLHIAGTSTVPLPWDLFARLPLLGHLLPARLAVFTDLGIAVLLAYGIGNRVRPATDRQRAIRAIACVAVVGSLLPSATLLGRLSDPVVTPAYFTTSAVKRIPDGFRRVGRAVDDRRAQRCARGMAGTVAFPVPHAVGLRVRSGPGRRRADRRARPAPRAGALPHGLRPRSSRRSVGCGNAGGAAARPAATRGRDRRRRADGPPRPRARFLDDVARTPAGACGRRVRLVRRREGDGRPVRSRSRLDSTSLPFDGFVRIRDHGRTLRERACGRGGRAGGVRARWVTGDCGGRSSRARCSWRRSA